MARNEPAPDPSAIKLKPIDQWIGADQVDVAHNLPPGEPITTDPRRMHNSTQDATRFETEASEVEQQQQQPEMVVNQTPSTAQYRTRMASPSNRQKNAGDLIVDAVFNDHMVGKLRLVGVPNQLKFEMIRTKQSKNELLLSFKGENVLTIDEYRQRCIGVCVEWYPKFASESDSSLAFQRDFCNSFCRSIP